MLRTKNTGKGKERISDVLPSTQTEEFRTVTKDNEQEQINQLSKSIDIFFQSKAQGIHYQSISIISLAKEIINAKLSNKQKLSLFAAQFKPQLKTKYKYTLTDWNFGMLLVNERKDKATQAYLQFLNQCLDLEKDKKPVQESTTTLLSVELVLPVLQTQEQSRKQTISHLIAYHYDEHTIVQWMNLLQGMISIDAAYADAIQALLLTKTIYGTNFWTAITNYHNSLLFSELLTNYPLLVSDAAYQTLAPLKETVLEKIKYMPEETKKSLLKSATHVDHPLGKLFWTQRGPRNPSLNRGTLKDIKKQLRFFTAPTSKPSVGTSAMMETDATASTSIKP